MKRVLSTMLIAAGVMAFAVAPVAAAPTAAGGVYVFEPQTDELDLGETYTYTFTAEERDVTEYVYTVNGGPQLTVTPPCQPCSADASIRVTSWHSTSVKVWARTADGSLSEPGDSWLPTRASWPFVSGDRDQIRFSQPFVKDIAEFRYLVNGATDERTVAARPDGSAELHIDFGDHPSPQVVVWGRTSDGIDTESFRYTL